MRFGVPSTAYTAPTIEEVAERIAQLGVDAVQWYRTVASGPPDAKECRRVRRAFESNGLDIDLIGGYGNPISTDLALRQASLDHLKGLCRASDDLGCKTIATFSGTANPVTAMHWVPETHSADNYALFVDGMRDVLRVAEIEGATIAIEPFTVTVMKDVDTALRILQDVASPSFGLVMDVANFFHPDDIGQPRQNELMTDCFTRLRPYIQSIHAKDLGPRQGERPTPSMPAAGQGQMDYRHFARLMRESGFTGALIVEHLYREEEIPHVLAYVRSFF